MTIQDEAMLLRMAREIFTEEEIDEILTFEDENDIDLDLDEILEWDDEYDADWFATYSA